MRRVAAPALAAVLALLSLSAAPADQALEPTAPANLRCQGLLDPGPPPDASGAWHVRWDYQWQVLSTDATFDQYVPMAVSLDSGCNAYVAGWSPTGGRVVKLSPSGATLAVWGSDGHAAGQFGRPEGIAVDPSGNIYVADADNNRVQELAPDGKVVRVWASTFGCRDIGVPCQTIPTDAIFSGNISVAVDGTGALSVGDGYHGVKRFAPQGALTTMWDTAVPDSAIEQITVDRRGTIWGAYTGNVIAHWSPDGKLLAKFGSRGSAPGQFALPRGIAVDADDNVYVAEEDNERLQKLDASGAPVQGWGRCASVGAGGPCSDNGQGDAPGQFFFPRGIAVDGRGEVWVTERANKRVQVLKATPTWVQADAAPSPASRPGTTSTAAVTDCGTDLECFVAQAPTCGPASVIYTVAVDLAPLAGLAQGFGTSVTEALRMQPSAGPGTCQFDIQIQRSETTLSPDAIQSFLDSGVSQDAIDQMQVTLASNSALLQGRSGTCQISATDLAAMLQRWADGSFSTEDWAPATCSGTYFNS